MSVNVADRRTSAEVFSTSILEIPVSLKWLLIFVPVSIALSWAEAGPTWVFLAACLAIVPLADMLAKATEHLAELLGPSVGGVLSATLGNGPELIVCGFALSKGLVPVVKSAIIGSVLMNVLLLPGLAMLIGGLSRPHQTFNKSTAGMSAALLTLASIGLVVPALFSLASPTVKNELSLEIASLLFVLYLLSLVFSMKTHRQLFTVATVPNDHAKESRSGLGVALAKLCGIAVVLAVVSEILTDALDPALAALRLSETFAGVIVLGSLGNVAQLIAAIRFGRADKMDLAMSSTVGAATQATLAMAPLLVFVGLAMGAPMDLQFSTFEVIAITLSVIVVGQLIRDGESNWFEGAMLIGVYGIFALGFYFHVD